MSAQPAPVALRPAGLLLSLFLFAAGAGLVYEGVQLFRFSQLQYAASALLSSKYTSTPYFTTFPAWRASLAEWRDTPGVRNRARAYYAHFTRSLSLTAPENMKAAIDVLKIDPVSANAWEDVAAAGLAMSRPDLALAGWEMSSLTAPREYHKLRWRLTFMPIVWDAASADQKRRYFFELDFATRADVPQGYRMNWSMVANTLNPAQRKQIEAEYKAYLHPSQ
ncbi:hypothetical protein FHS55_003516 [Angulomicrobium tetraedrale]|uniref:Uncharacterized protein n=1 Tax=Ancylobacter tetraedralis TaxID=217068 RepID=A0A839ZDM4_9HYPH|nr:hypothetical protein [Ancylobacter tetraedralis]MBB3772891.1 hypothetical protein [Ancylobacter tetraedralis]